MDSSAALCHVQPGVALVTGLADSLAAVASLGAVLVVSSKLGKLARRR